MPTSPLNVSTGMKISASAQTGRETFILACELEEGQSPRTFHLESIDAQRTQTRFQVNSDLFNYNYFDTVCSHDQFNTIS